jgi:hypothetical protein
MLKIKNKLTLVLLITAILPLATLAQTDTASQAATSAPPAVATAPTETISISPQIIDAKAKARDILNYEITIKNNSLDRKYDLYVTVEDLTAEGKTLFTDPINFDKATSLGRWLRIRRGPIEVMPGQTVTEPLKIEVNMNALPGIYHASITFCPGSSAAEARANAPASQSKTLINLAVEEVIVEKVEIKRFDSVRSVYLKPPAAFNLELFNLGTENIIPKGMIGFYDRQGREIDTIVINSGQKNIAPNTTEIFSLTWKPQQGFGKYRAKLYIEYGREMQRDLNDMVDFWILPLSYVLLAGGGVLILFILLTILIFKKTYPGYHTHEEKDGVIDLKNH